MAQEKVAGKTNPACLALARKCMVLGCVQRRVLAIFAVLTLSMVWAVLIPSSPLLAAEEFNYEEALRLSQAAIGNSLDDYSFLDSNGRKITLESLRGKPLVVSMVYTSCYNICSFTTRNLAQVVESARKSLGDDSFNVITIGFDTRFDTPQHMAAFAKQQGVDLPGWRFLSSDAETIPRLSKALGFLYFPSSRGFDHLVQTTLVDSAGVIYRQVYGEVIDPPLLLEPLKQLVLGRPQPNHTVIEDVIRRVRFFCTVYDPAQKRYRFDYSLFIGLFIGAGIIITGFYLLYRDRRRAKSLPLP